MLGGHILCGYTSVPNKCTHQFYNQDSIPCTYLDIKTVVGLDVCEYPDSGKINISPFNEIFVKDSQVDYFKGEDNVDEIWGGFEKQ